MLQSWRIEGILEDWYKSIEQGFSDELGVNIAAERHSATVNGRALIGEQVTELSTSIGK